MIVDKVKAFFSAFWLYVLGAVGLVIGVLELIHLIDGGAEKKVQEALVADQKLSDHADAAIAQAGDKQKQVDDLAAQIAQVQNSEGDPDWNLKK
jgi:hypothetical protein